MPMSERQLDISLVIEQYQQILSALASKDSVSLVTMVEGVGMISRILKPSLSEETREGEESSTERLQALMAKHGMIETLLDVVRDARLDSDQKRALLPVAVNGVNLLLRDCEAARQRMAKVSGYDRLFEAVGGAGPPDAATLRAVLAMATHAAINGRGAEVEVEDALIRNIEPVSYLLKWMRETEFEDNETQTWLVRSLRKLCSSRLQNRMLCCQSGVLLQVIECLREHGRLRHASALELLKMAESLGTHSISPYELKQLVMLLRPGSGEGGDSRFPYKSHVIHIVSSMARRDGYEACRRYFEVGPESRGLSVPGIRDWSAPAAGLTFHCWLRLDKGEAATVESAGLPGRRRQLYSLYTSGGNGFEAFVTSRGILVKYPFKKTNRQKMQVCKCKN